MSDHTYPTTLRWNGSTAAGYRSYPRNHQGAAPPATTPVELSADPHFRGDRERLNPEQLLVMAASSCQLLSFLAVSSRAGVDVVGYEDSAVGTMPVRRDAMSIETIRLTPFVVVAPGTDHDLVHRLVHQAHDECYIAASLNTKVTVEATVAAAPPSSPGPIADGAESPVGQNRTSPKTVSAASRVSATSRTPERRPNVTSESRPPSL